ncbi:transposase [Periweissella beninensis]|uniref:transposase n=1 Tax=Periweissella beninensis TaxID=504936 RepID=UPI0028897BA4|nr:transposase [Periweissella beninensis]MCT4396949.1 hypothetical protein [Periweissella beninensis]
MAAFVNSSRLPYSLTKRRPFVLTIIKFCGSTCKPLNNAPVKPINNKIKVISRIAYSFKNFENFRERILIIFKNSYFTINYKKATNSNYELVA